MVFLTVFAFFSLSLATSASLLIRTTLAVVIGVGAVYAWVAHKAKKRMSILEEQLPDAVELMVRSLRVGHPFSSAIQIVADEVPDPLGTEIGLIADESAYGRDIGEALSALAERVDNQDMRFLAVAVTIQQTSGGNLAEILESLSKVIRSRFKLFRRVRAITAEAKWSGIFLSGFPFLALIGINIVEPTYYDEVSKSFIFIPACLIVAAFLILNVIVMRMLVNIKV
jgi:tight adherence protein B